MLDDLLGNAFALVAFGPDAQRALAEAAGQDFGVPVQARIGVMPRWLNADTDAPDAASAVRDVNGAMKAFVDDQKTTVMLVRPDRYIAAAGEYASGAIGDLATQARSLAARSGG